MVAIMMVIDVDEGGTLREWGEDSRRGTLSVIKRTLRPEIQ